MQQVKLVSADKELKFSLSGEIDAATSEDFYAQVAACYEHDKKDVLFDCAALTFIDSTTLGTFVKIYKKLNAEGSTQGRSLRCCAHPVSFGKFFSPP